MLAPTDQVQAFNDSVNELDRRGFQALTEPFRAGKLTLKAGRSLLPFAAPIKLDKNKILVRKLEAGQQGVWQVANVLFEYQTREDFKNTKWVWPEGGGLTAMLNSDKSILAYLRSTQPTWAQQVLERMRVREELLYSLLKQLDQIKAEDVLPANDSYRTWFAKRGFIPNLKTYLNREDGRERKLVWTYYIGNIMRIMMVAMTLSNVANIPQYYSMTEQYITQAQTQVLTAQDKYLLHERDQLVAGIHHQLGLPVPNQHLLTSMQNELKQLHDLSPKLIESANP